MGPRRPGTAFPAGLLAGLLPAGVVGVDARDESFDGDRLVGAPDAVPDSALAAEWRALGSASAGRRQEFARARVCAHVAMAVLGHPVEPVLMGGHREPRWPAGLVGSITHCPGFRAAAVARASAVLAVGIDAEVDQPLPAGVGALALTDTDRAASGPLARFGNWPRVAFSARESVFKAWFAVTGRWLDFPDAVLSLAPEDPAGGTFSATIGAGVAGLPDLVRAGGSPVVAGRFRLAAGLIVTAVSMPHPCGPAALPGRPRTTGHGL